MADFFQWYWSDMPRLLLRVGRGVLRYIYFGLSVPLLVRTIGAPWKRDVQSLENLTLPEKLGILVENLVSRVFGAIVRLSTLCVALISALCVIILAIFIFCVWLVLPFIAIILVGYGARLLIGSY